MNALDPVARELINRFQGGFPLSERPYFQVAAKLGIKEAALTPLLESLLGEGYLSRFGPLYDAARLGGALTLAAMSVPEAVFERVAAQVNALPAVAHNYKREHALNMWFVVATGSPEELPEVLREIEAKTGIPVHSFPKEREFYLGLWLRLDANGRVDTVSSPQRELAPSLPLDELDRAIIAATQDGLPLQDDPYVLVGRQLGVDSGVLLQRLRGMLETGVIRRIGAVPNHYRLGLRGNGMTVWDIPDGEVDALGKRLGGLDFVSHCYRRPRHPGVWPYNLFAMVHGADRLEVLAKTEQMTALLDGHFRAYDVLFSGAVLKKTGLRLAA